MQPNNGMKMDGLYLAVSMNTGLFPLPYFSRWPGFYPPATYACRSALPKGE